jgi:hypothetical protein
MPDDEPFYSPTYKPPPPRQPRPGEFLWEFRGENHHTYRCELRYHGEWGAEAQILRDGELMMGRRFDTRALAVQWGDQERAYV